MFEDATEAAEKRLPPAEKGKVTKALNRIERAAEEEIAYLRETTSTGQDLLKDISALKATVITELEKIQERAEALEGHSNRAKDVVSDIEAQLLEITGNDEQEGLVDEVKQAGMQVTAAKKEIEETYSIVKDAEELLFGSGDNRGLAGDFEDKLRQLDKEIQRAENFLGRATTASLSNDFDSAHKYYGRLSLLAWLFAAAPIATLAWFAIRFIWNGAHIPQEYTLVEYLSLRTLVTLPVLAFSGFASAVAVKWDRLSAEYRHKQTVAKSFEGYKRVVEELYSAGDDRQMLDKLYNQVLTSFGENPNDKFGKPDRKTTTGKAPSEG